MSAKEKDIWDPHFFASSPLFNSLQRVSEQFVVLSSWPSLHDYSAAFSSAGLRVKPVSQAAKPSCFEELYESRIYLKGELQTRLENWHDFFNALVWLCFPETKAMLNELHYFSSLQRAQRTNRSKLENALTLFDECGAIVISHRSDLLDMIRQHEWEKLFVENRDSFNEEIKCIVFGHAMFEKALNPYVGMTANTLLIHSQDLLNADLTSIDRYLARYWKDVLIESTAELKPLPILGVPGWYVANEDPDFYKNKHYFRPRRD